MSLPSGTYLFGGYSSPNTTDFLPASSDTWQAGPPPPLLAPEGTYGGCGVAVSITEIVFVGGNKVIKYNTVNNQETAMERLPERRSSHACALLNGNIIVGGGVYSGIRPGGPHLIRSTYIISLSTGIVRTRGNINEPRYSHAMVTLDGLYPAIGGVHVGFEVIPSIEEWNKEDEIWETSKMNLSKERSQFGAVAIPSALICSKS